MIPCNFLHMIGNKSLGIFEVHVGTRIFLFTTKCIVVGQLLTPVQKVSACPPGLASVGTSDAWQADRSV